MYCCEQMVMGSLEKGGVLFVEICVMIVRVPGIYLRIARRIPIS